jgi:Tol biopolymer transport system component/DNA-binding winged helix-turn-helix (wHTH) protein
MSEVRQIYEFEGFRLDRTNKVLKRNGTNIPLTRKMFETLDVLVENAGRLVEKDELMQKIWHDRHVEESNLTYNIKMLRKTLGDSASQPKFIETVPRHGYRFIAEVEQITEQNNNSQPFAVAPPQSAPVAQSFYLTVLLLIIILAGSLGLAAWIWKGNSGGATAPILSAEFDSTKLSDTGKVFHAVISPDGQYMAYTNKVGGKESLWLRHLETANNTQIIPPSDDIYYGLAFSNGGETLFFTRDHAAASDTIDVYRIPLMGGVPLKVAAKTQGWISLSPDDRQISFVRYDEGGIVNRLMVADVDGKNEREIKVSEPPSAFWVNAFSPDGRTIAAAYGHSLNASRQMGLVEIDVASGELRELTPEKFFHIKDLKWLPNKSGLIFSANQFINDNARIWKLDYQTKTVGLVSKDSVEYSSLSLTRKADKMVATTYSPDFYLYLQNSDSPANFTRSTQARDRFIFTPDGKIVYASDAAGNEDIWIMEADGTNQRQLTTDKSLDFTPLVSPDNRHIFYTSNRTGESQIWRINADGSNQMQITHQEGGYPRFITPDGKWLYYQSALSTKLWKVSTGGGEEILFDEDCGYYQAFSPDGNLLGFLFRDKETKSTKIKVISPESRKVLKTFDTPAKITSFAYFLRWRNNSTLAYLIDEINGRAAVWEQELNKDKPQIRQDLGDEDIMDIEYSADGEKFAFIRGNWQHDAFLIKGLK